MAHAGRQSGPRNNAVIAGRLLWEPNQRLLPVLRSYRRIL